MEKAQKNKMMTTMTTKTTDHAKEEEPSKVDEVNTQTFVEQPEPPLPSIDTGHGRKVG